MFKLFELHFPDLIDQRNAIRLVDILETLNSPNLFRKEEASLYYHGTEPLWTTS